jgi:hypothetical protein
MVRIIKGNKDEHLLKDGRNFLRLFKHATLQEQNKRTDNFRDGFLRFYNGFNNIYELEKPRKIEEFTSAFCYLISTVKQIQERGLWRKTYFNLFETLGYQRLEDTHSNILAWLLNPEESHGLGDAFLRAFVDKVFNITNLPIIFPVKVFREKQEGNNRPDVIVEGNNWWLVIENKIDSDEQEDQIKRYANRWKRRGKLRENVLLAFLSPSGWKPESNDFIPVSYRTIRELLENKSMSFKGDSNFLCRHFIDHIILDLEE